MKSIKVILLLVVMMTMGFQAKADHDQVIPFNQMPEAPKRFSSSILPIRFHSW